MRTNETTPNTSEPLESIHFLTDKDEASTTISALLAVCMQAVHSNSGELMDQERDHIAWLLYFANTLVKDFQKIKH